MPGGPPTFRLERLRSQFLAGPGGSSPEGVVGKFSRSRPRMIEASGSRSGVVRRGCPLRMSMMP